MNSPVTMQTRFNAIVVATLCVGVIAGYALAVFHPAHPASVPTAPLNSMATSSLQGKTGVDFDRTFLREMIVHHQGAVDMANLALQQSQRPELKAFATKMLQAQSAEIQQMHEWEKAWF